MSASRDRRKICRRPKPISRRWRRGRRKARVVRSAALLRGHAMTYYDLGAYSRLINTKSAEAQVWFDRGLNWVFGFNHAEAIKCFGKALEHDPRCAMAQWGVSYAAGPNYNLP